MLVEGDPPGVKRMRYVSGIGMVDKKTRKGVWYVNSLPTFQWESAKELISSKYSIVYWKQVIGVLGDRIQYYVPFTEHLGYSIGTRRIRHE